MNPSPPLLDLLGVEWDVKSAVVAVAWDGPNRTVACACADGVLVLAQSVWPQGPHLAPRPEGGGLAVVAATQAAPEPLRVRAHPKACLAMQADRLGGFVSGGAEGRVVHVSVSGGCSQLARLPGQAIHAVASGSAGTRAWAAGRQLYRQRLQQLEQIELPGPASDLAFDPTGHCLAAAHVGGATLWPLAQAETTVAPAPQSLAWPGQHSCLAWHPDGSILAGASQGEMMHAWRVADGADIVLPSNPNQPHRLAFSSDGRWLLTSGSPQPLAWRFDLPLVTAPPQRFGTASQALVCQVACHPSQPLVACGYTNGAIALCQPGRADVLVLRAAGAAEVSALAWSADGSRLAFGSADCRFGWVHLPAELFRFPTA